MLYVNWNDKFKKEIIVKSKINLPSDRITKVFD